MPSTKDPVEVVQPGPGRLPAGTVPASALIFPPGAGGSDAALQAHIADPVGAHAATAINVTPLNPWADGTPNNEIEVQAALADIVDDLAGNLGANRPGQPGYVGETFSIGAGTLGSAVSRLFEGVNTRMAWVLDPNPAAANADFAGPNALINALAAIGTPSHPVLYLRPGTYNYDGSPFTNVTVIGASRFTTTIQNTAGNLLATNGCLFANVTIDLTGDLNLFGPFNTFTFVHFDVDGIINLTGQNNVLEHVRGHTAPQVIVVNGTNHTIRDFYNCVIELLSTADNSVVDHGSISSVRSLSQEVLKVASDQNSISNIYITLPAPLTNETVEISGTDNNLSNINLANITSAPATLVVLAGQGNHLTGLSFDGITLNASVVYALFAGTSNSIDGVRFTNSTLPFADNFGVQVTGTNHELSNVEFDGGGVLDPAGTFIQMASCINCHAQNVEIRNIRALQAGCKIIWMAGAQNSALQNVFINGIESNAGSTDPILRVEGTKDQIINNVKLKDIGTGSNLGVPIIWLSGISGGMIDNVCADGITDTVSAGRFIDIVSATPTSPLTIKNCTGRIQDSADNAFHAVSINAIAVDVRDCIFQAQGGGASTSSATVFVENCGVFSFRNVTIGASHGRAAAFPSSPVKLDHCLFAGGSDDPGAGRQLFYGYGAAISPLTLNDCQMFFGSSNCDPSPASSDPIVFFGGRDGAAIPTHGPSKVDGLTIIPDGSVGATSLHNGSVLHIDDELGYGKQRSSLSNIKIDLLEKTWDAAVSAGPPVVQLEAGPNPFPYPPLAVEPLVNNLQIYNVKESGNNLDKTIFDADGGVVNGLVIEGSSTPGPNRFEWPLVSISDCVITGISLCRNNPIRINDTSCILGSRSKIIGGTITNAMSGTFFDGYVDFFNDCTLENVHLYHSATSTIDTGGALVQFGDNAIIKNNHFRVAVDIAVSGREILQSSNGDGSIISGNVLERVNPATDVWRAMSFFLLDYCHISDNTILNIGTDGSLSEPAIYLSGDQNTMSNNTLRAVVDTSGPGVFFVLHIDSLSDGNTVTGNVFENDAGDPASIYLRSDGDWTVISGNILLGRDDGGSGVFIQDNISGSFNVITSNILFNRGIGTGIISPAGSSITANNMLG
jgi:hypothetical protein